MKRELNSRITYCQTAAISQRAAKAHQGKLKEIERQQTKTGGRESEGWKQICERSEGESAEWSVETDCR